MNRTIFPIILVGLLAQPAVSSAALVDRGGGLIYDSILDVTWLQDANYAKTSGYDADGRLNWSSAKAWASDLDYFDSVRKVSYTDWRLPSVAPVGTSFIFDFRYDGTSDRGYGITSPNSELSHLWYVSLGNLGACRPESDANATGCIPQSGWGLQNSGPFDNLQDSIYWSGSGFIPANPYYWGWVFNALGGRQDQMQDIYEGFVWAVRDGDVANIASSVPEPGSAALLTIAMLGLLGCRRRTTARTHGAD